MRNHCHGDAAVKHGRADKGCKWKEGLASWYVIEACGQPASSDLRVELPGVEARLGAACGG